MERGYFAEILRVCRNVRELSDEVVNHAYGQTSKENSCRSVIPAYAGTTAASQRNIIVLLPYLRDLFVPEHAQRADDAPACGMGTNDVVDITASGCNKRIEEAVFIFFRAFGDRLLVARFL